MKTGLSEDLDPLTPSIRAAPSTSSIQILTHTLPIFKVRLIRVVSSFLGQFVLHGISQEYDSRGLTADMPDRASSPSVLNSVFHLLCASVAC